MICKMCEISKWCSCPARSKRMSNRTESLFFTIWLVSSIRISATVMFSYIWIIEFCAALAVDSEQTVYYCYYKKKTFLVIGKLANLLLIIWYLLPSIVSISLLTIFFLQHSQQEIDRKPTGSLHCMFTAMGVLQAVMIHPNVRGTPSLSNNWFRRFSKNAAHNPPAHPRSKSFQVSMSRGRNCRHRPYCLINRREGKQQGCEFAEVPPGRRQIKRLYCCGVEAVIQREVPVAGAWGLPLKPTTSIWASDRVRKKGRVERAKERMDWRRSRVHLGKLLVIFRPDLYISPAPTCLPYTTCFLSVTLDLIPPAFPPHIFPPALFSLSLVLTPSASPISMILSRHAFPIFPQLLLFFPSPSRFQETVENDTWLLLY